MIYDKMQNVSNYLGISETLDKAIAFIQSCDPKALNPGRNEISGDDLYCNRITTTAKASCDVLFEKHEVYIDIHVVISGEEYIELGYEEDFTLVSDYDKENDMSTYKGDGKAKVLLEPGKFCICFTQDVHKPAVNDFCVGKEILKYVIKAKK